MHSMFRIPGCLALLALCQCQADDSDALGGLTQAQAPYEPSGTVGTPPQDPCADNDICNWYQCGEDDPDCEEAPSIESSETTTGGLTQGTLANAALGSWEFEGDVYLTPISGFESDDEFTLGTPTSSRRAVYSLLLRERSDEPCHAAIGIEDLDDETIDDVPVLNLCGGEQPTSSTLPGSFLDVNAIGGENDHDFLSGVSVCMNRDDDKVKGLSVVGKRLTGTGGVVFLDADEDPPHRPNCHTWMPFVECPHEQIATAVELYFRDGNRQSLTGVALHCRTPVWTSRVRFTP